MNSDVGTDALKDIDIALDLDQRWLFVENGHGTGALGFEWTSDSFNSARNAFLDVAFDGGTEFDGIFLDGTTLWSVDLGTLDADNDKMTLKGFTVADTATALPMVFSVTGSVPGNVKKQVRTRARVCNFDADGNYDHAGCASITDGFDDDYRSAWFWDRDLFVNHERWIRAAASGFVASGIWGDTESVYVVDAHTGFLYRLDKGDLDRGVISRTGLVSLEIQGATLPGEDNLSPTAVWGDGTTLWIADTGSSRLKAFDIKSGWTRDRDQDITITHGGCAQVIWGLWGDHLGDALFMNAVSSGSGCRGWRLLRYDRSDGIIDVLASSPHPSTGRDIWSDGVTLWIATDHGKIEAYGLASGTAFNNRDITVRTAGSSPRKLRPRGIWSDGTNMYVGTQNSGEILIYKLAD